MAKKREKSKNLCEELVTEILLRVPTAAVAVRLKVVCKPWYSLISSPYFINRFINLRGHRAVESSLVRNFLCDRDSYNTQYDSMFQIISDDSLLRNVYGDRRFYLSFLPCSPRYLRFQASFADLILCSTYKTNNYYVINLLTKEWIALPQHPVDEGCSLAVGVLCVPPPSFECKFLVDKFVVVRFCEDPYLTPRSQFEVQVFSSEDSRWRTLVLTLENDGLTKYYSNYLVAYRGMMHWMLTDCIAVYDPLSTHETFSRVIPLPIQVFYRSSCLLGVCQGHIRIVEASSYQTVLDVWELQDYDSGLWNLIHKVHYKNLTCDDRMCIVSFSLVSVHPENEDVLYLKSTNGFVSFNIKSKTVERHYPVRKYNTRYGWEKTFHLADQCWPTPVLSLLH